MNKADPKIKTRLGYLCDKLTWDCYKMLQVFRHTFDVKKQIKLTIYF